jgi:hypothetical protein
MALFTLVVTQQHLQPATQVEALEVEPAGIGSPNTMGPPAYTHSLFMPYLHSAYENEFFDYGGNIGSWCCWTIRSHAGRLLLFVYVHIM